MQELTTIKIFSLHNDLYLAKSFLESEGIECFVKDEFINQVYPLGNNDFGAKLQVSAELVEKAVQLLIEGGFAKENDYGVPEDTKQTDKFLDRLKKLFK